MKITIEGGIYLDKSYTGGDPRYVFFEGDCRSFMDYTAICEATVNGYAPDDFNPTAAMLELLHKQAKELDDKYAAASMELKQRINSLLAIENAS